MSTSSKAPILAGVDGSGVALAAVRWAAVDAAHRGAPLHLVYLTGGLGDCGSGVERIPSAPGRHRWGGPELLEIAYASAVAESARINRIEVTVELTNAAPVPVLRRRSEHARLLVVGSQELGAFSRAMRGSLSTALARQAGCPVAVVPNDAENGDGPVVVGVDASASSAAAIALAFDEAVLRGADLVVVHALSGLRGNGSPTESREQGEELLDRSLTGYSEAYPEVTVRRVVVEDRPARRLLEMGEKARSIVVGSRGHDELPAMPLGSVSRAVLHAAQVPVIVTRGGDR
ncbi:universal stress protein [Nocardia implantans]|uniref:Universal stress protein n=1 Tax=Nocardia implantans TaxID=3108168 RepID=A0ABU6B412_9NOCA|nr:MULTISPECIES: universal stress protein [unclassified Nocardia]MBF6196259.1 universal stress protein [Nocardia beijingensis]MEA3527777.1 universal stress protein [Nocardia sp. CDC192]MEB3514517.1 universal stress protein [Nocardia sp. CDC186]